MGTLRQYASLITICVNSLVTITGHQMYAYKCKIVSIVDGDTIDIELDLGFEIRLKERVRLLGVDTPEVYGNKAVPAGQAASAFTKAWVQSKVTRDGHFVYESKRYNARDKYGRSLGTITWVDAVPNLTETINVLLLATGHAKPL